MPVSVNMGFGIRSRPTTPLIAVRRLEELGVKRVTLPRMLAGAAIRGMSEAISAFRTAARDGEVVDRPELSASIDEIWALIGQPDAMALEKRLLSLDGPASKEGFIAGRP